jgi:predicted metalloenzyme YecM
VTKVRRESEWEQTVNLLSLTCRDSPFEAGSTHVRRSSALAKAPETSRRLAVDRTSRESSWKSGIVVKLVASPARRGERLGSPSAVEDFKEVVGHGTRTG